MFYRSPLDTRTDAEIAEQIAKNLAAVEAKRVAFLAKRGELLWRAAALWNTDPTVRDIIEWALISHDLTPPQCRLLWARVGQAERN